MGAGSSALIWYGLCLAFVAFVVIVSTGLIFYGQLVENRRARASKQGIDAPRAEDPGFEDLPSSLDPTSGDR
jgi:hypothetical protein